jgi:hypothetical protein
MGNIQQYITKAKMGLTAGCLAFVGALVLTSAPTHAATPPDTCFNFDGTTGTISTYYDNENNDTAQPACPKNVDIPATIDATPVTAIGQSAFSNKQLTGVTIPSSVTSIGHYAFSQNQLTSINIPNTVESIGSQAFSQNQLTTANWPSGVTTISNSVFMNNQLASFTIPATVTVIDEGAFMNNQLSSITIPSSVTTIDQMAFALNKIVSVTLPNSVTSLSPLAFMFQNPNGGNLPQNPTPQEIQQVYDSIWYAQVYTENPANPNNLQSFAYVILESDVGQDVNNDGDTADKFSMGGHIINPASVTIGAHSTSGTQLAPDSTQVGALADGTAVPDYSAPHTPNALPDLGTLMVNSGGDEAATLTAADTAMKAIYHTTGASKTFTAPTIAGYTLQSPASPHSLTLATRTNTLNFVYAAATTEGGTTPTTPTQGGSTTSTPNTANATGTPNAPDSGVSNNTMLAALVGTIAFVTGVTFAGLRIAAARRR